jgi:ankyrin repeat protein
VQELLQEGAGSFSEYVSSVDKAGETPLHLAVRAGNIECCKVLLDSSVIKSAQQAPIDVQSKKGDTPLILAACWGRDHIFNLLLAAGGRTWT